MELKTSFFSNFFRLCFFKSVELKEGYVCLNNKWFGFIDFYGDAFNAENAVFFDLAQGLTGKLISFGGLEKTTDDKVTYVKIGGKDYINRSVMDITGLSKDKVEIIKNYLIKNGSKLVEKHAVEYKSKFPIFKFGRWFCPRETLRIGEEGILHTKKTLLKSKSSYVPFEDLKFFSGYGAFRKKVTFLGDVSVISKERFSKQDFKKIEEKVQSSSSCFCEEGKMYRPSWISFKSRKKNIILLRKGIICNDKKKAGFFEYKDVSYSFSKKHWWWILGTLRLEAFREDAREGSLTFGNLLSLHNTFHEFEVPGLPVWKWRILFFFSAPLKKTLKRKSREQKRKEKKENKKAARADRRYDFSEE